MKVLVKIISVLLGLSLISCVYGCSPFGGKLNATCIDVNNSDFFAKFYTDQEKYDYLLDGFNFTDDEKMDYLRRYDGLCGVKLCIEVVNKNDFDIKVIGLEIKRNGEDETVISTMPRLVVELAANTEEPQKVWFDVFADGASYTNEELLDMAKKMGLRIIYVDASTGIESLTDADVDNLIYENVK